MVFCYLCKLFWEMHLLFCKCRRWFEKCTKVTEKNCNILARGYSLSWTQPESFLGFPFCVIWWMLGLFWGQPKVSLHNLPNKSLTQFMLWELLRPHLFWPLCTCLLLQEDPGPTKSERAICLTWLPISGCPHKENQWPPDHISQQLPPQQSLCPTCPYPPLGCLRRSPGGRT